MLFRLHVLCQIFKPYIVGPKSVRFVKGWNCWESASICHPFPELPDKHTSWETVGRISQSSSADIIYNVWESWPKSLFCEWFPVYMLTISLTFVAKFTFQYFVIVPFTFSPLGCRSNGLMASLCVCRAPLVYLAYMNVLVWLRISRRYECAYVIAYISQVWMCLCDCVYLTGMNVLMWLHISHRYECAYVIAYISQVWMCLCDCIYLAGMNVLMWLHISSRYECAYVTAYISQVWMCLCDCVYLAGMNVLVWLHISHRYECACVIVYI